MLVRGGVDADGDLSVDEELEGGLENQEPHVDAPEVRIGMQLRGQTRQSRQDRGHRGYLLSQCFLGSSAMAAPDHYAHFPLHHVR